MLKGKEVDYIVLENFELQTLDTRLYGVAPTAGRDDREGFIGEVKLPNDNTMYIVYTECWYHYSCTKNYSGENIIEIDGEYYISIPSETTDYDCQVFYSLEDAKKYVNELYEYYGYYDYYEEVEEVD